MLKSTIPHQWSSMRSILRSYMSLRQFHSDNSRIHQLQSLPLSYFTGPSRLALCRQPVARPSQLTTSIGSIYPSTVSDHLVLRRPMSSSASEKKLPSVPRPSASILLISPTNEILLLRRVQTSKSFPSAHVFPGGNISAQDGEIPGPEDEARHRDGEVYRMAAVRECFEESGILLARSKRGEGGLLRLGEKEREEGRKKVHAKEVGFTQWLQDRGGIVDTENLIPFTRWITPPNIPHRFTTQMYLYFLPLSQSSSGDFPNEGHSIIPTHDGGLEHLTASFAPISSWLSQARANEITLFPPQFYLMHLLSPFLTTSTPTSTSTSPLSSAELQSQRDQVKEFLKGDGGDGSCVPWGEKVMSPKLLLLKKKEKISVLGLNDPGEAVGRVGDAKRVVLVKFGNPKEGPRDVEVRERSEVLEEERAELGKL